MPKVPERLSTGDVRGNQSLVGKQEMGSGSSAQPLRTLSEKWSLG